MTIETNDSADDLLVENHSFVDEFDQLMLELNMMLRCMHEHIVRNLISQLLKLVEHLLSGVENVDYEYLDMFQ
jgi:hypothetical protein